MHVASVAKQWSSEMNWRHFFGYKQYPKGERIWGFVLFYLKIQVYQYVYSVLFAYLKTIQGLRVLLGSSDVVIMKFY